MYSLLERESKKEDTAATAASPLPFTILAASSATILTVLLVLLLSTRNSFIPTLPSDSGATPQVVASVPAASERLIGSPTLRAPLISRLNRVPRSPLKNSIGFQPARLALARNHDVQQRRRLAMRSMDVEGASKPIAQTAEGEEREGENDLMDAISTSIPEKNAVSFDSFDAIGQDLYMEWMMQAVNTLTVKVSNSPLNDLKLWLWKKAAGEYDKDAIKAKIDSTLASHPLVVFGSSMSPFTKKALAVLDKAGAKYEYIPMETQGDSSVPMRAYLAEQTGRTSLPSIWIKQKFVGGCFDGPEGGVASMSPTELNNLLKEAGAL